MRISIALAALAALCLPAPGAAQAPPVRDQDRAYQAVKQGRALSLPQIEARVVPRMRGWQYLGPEQVRENVYRLKFMREGRVVWLDVDASTGRIVARSGR